jgi:hypothetical protein
MERASPAHQTSWRQTTSGGGEDADEEVEVEVETADEEGSIAAIDHSISARPMPATRSLLSLEAGNSRPQQLRVMTLTVRRLD